jgi:sugar transferase (PEP-CTERM/EpsH1 system associated)
LIGVRILFVVPNVPSRIRVRPFNFIRRLSRQHEVTVFCVATNDVDYRSIAELRQHCQAVEVFELPHWRSLWNCLVGAFSSRALRTAYFYCPRLRRRLVEKVGRGGVDLVHAEHLKSVPMVAGVSGKVPTVFDAVDCISMMEAKRRKVIRNPLLKLFFWTEQKKMARWEAQASELFDRVVISSPVDSEFYPGGSRLKEAIRVVPNCVDLEYFGFRQFEPRKNLVVFCANLSYFPNVDAALYFSRSVWPLLLARRPNLRLEIVGSRPPRSVRQLDGKNNIHVVGSVPDVRPHLGRAWAALCPLRVRAGTQSKILEAMAMGVPVVATRICCAGLQVEPGKHLLTADTPEEFVSGVESLLDGSSLRNNLVQAGRKYVEAHHDWNRSMKELLDVYAEALADFKREECVAAS